MMMSQIKTAKNGYKYLRIEKDHKAFCIFETEDYLISHIYGECENFINNENQDNYTYYGMDLNDLENILTIQTYNIFKDAYDNKWKIKKESEDYYKRMSNIDNVYDGLCNHDKPSNHYIFNRDILEDTIFEDDEDDRMFYSDFFGGKY